MSHPSSGGVGDVPLVGFYLFFGKEVPVKGYRDCDVRVAEAVAEGDLRVKTPKQLFRKPSKSYFDGGVAILRIAKKCHGAQAERLRLKADVLFAAHSAGLCRSRPLPSGSMLELG
jgi:hypothetical protein